MKQNILLVMIALFSLLAAESAYSMESMYLWYDEAYDQNGTLLGKRDTAGGSHLFSLDALDFTVTPLTGKIKIVASYIILGGISLDSEFDAINLIHLKNGSTSVYSSSYADSLITAGELNSMLPIAPAVYGQFSFYTASPYDIDSVAVGDEFKLTAWTSYIHLTNNAYPQNSRNIAFRNEAVWNVKSSVPEPGVASLLFMGLMAFAGAGRKYLRGR